MKKKGGKSRLIYSIFLMFLFIILAQMTSADLGDWYNRITGKATTDTTTVSVTIGNSAPTITYVSDVSAVSPSEAGTRYFSFTFNATDTDGVANFNDSAAIGSVNLSGEVTRTNTSCTPFTDDGTNEREYNCTIGMEYWDGTGSWSINATIYDINGAAGENVSTTFTYNQLTAMVMSPAALSWASVGLSDTDTGADDNPLLLNNTGNDESLAINFTGYNLRGTTDTDEFIFAANFTVENSADGCSGDDLVNATEVNITSAVLEKGNNTMNVFNSTSGQEQLYVCLKGVPVDISAQDYTSSAYGAWIAEIVT